MKQYLKKLKNLYGVWENFKEVIENAEDVNMEEDFNDILLVLPADYIPYFLKWTIDIQNESLVTINTDKVMEVIIKYKEYRKVWIEETLSLLHSINDPKVDKTISDNLMDIIKNPYKRGRTWVILDLIERVKDIGNSREEIEQNYGDILETIFSNNDFLSNNKEVLLKIEKLMRKLTEQEDIGLSDIERIGSGQYSECFKIGEVVIKFGKGRILDELPSHRRILSPMIRKNFPNNPREEIEDGKIKSADVLAIECQSVVDTSWYEELTDREKEKKLYDIYKELRTSNIIWTDIKVENVGRLLKPNVVEAIFKGPNGENLKREVTLPTGELVIFDTDRLYYKDKLPEFNDNPSKKKLYQIFEEKYLEEKQQEESR